MAIDSAVSDRFELVTVPRAKGVPSFAQEVAAGLSAAPKRLPSKFHYDDVGSALFEAITRLPEYYLTRTERALLEVVAPRVTALLPGPVVLIEYGASDEEKAGFLLREKDRRAKVERSRVRKKMISSSVINTGMVASTTAAIPEGMRCSAQKRQP